MPTQNRKRPVTVKVMTTMAEKKELLKAAAKTGVPLAVLMRTFALAAVRRGEIVSIEARPA